MTKEGNAERKSFIRRPRLLYAAFLALAVTLAASVTATYAWFEVSNAAEVTMIQIKPKYDANLSIGMKNADGVIDYGEIIDPEYIKDHDPTYENNKALSPCSSMFKSDWLNEEFDPAVDYPLLSQGYQTALHAEGKTGIAEKKDYIQLEFYFHSSYDSYLYVDPASYFDPLHDVNRIKAEELGTDLNHHRALTGEDLDKITDCIRISFLSESWGYTIMDPNKNGDTYLAGPLDLDRQGYYDYDSTSKKELCYGEYLEGKEPTYTDEPLEEDIGDGEYQDSFNSSHRKGTYMISSPQSEYAVEEGAYSFSDLCLKEYQNFNDPTWTKPLAYLPSGEDVRVVVTIYIEGWDTDTIDSIQAGSFALGLTFNALLDNI